MTMMELNEMKGLWSLYQSAKGKSEELNNRIDAIVRLCEIEEANGHMVDVEEAICDAQVEADNWYIQNEYPAFNSLVESVAYHFGLSSKQARQMVGSPKFSRMMQEVK